MSWSALERAISTLLCDEPFYGHLIAQLNRIETEKIPTLGVGLMRGRIQLLWNADFFNSLQKFQHKRAILKHEILHIILQHITRGLNYQDHERANIAMDLVVNQLVGRENLPTDEEHRGKYIEDFQEKFGQDKFPKNETVDFYYKILREMSDEEVGVAPKHHWVVIGEGDGDGEGEGEGEGDDGGGKMQVLSSQTLSEAEQAMIEAQSREMIEKAKSQDPEGWGNLPGHLKSMLDELFERVKPQLPWKVILKRFIAKSNKSRITYTMKRVSKRFGVRPGLKKDQKLHVMLVLDTSGSVSDEQFVTFFKELDGMYRTAGVTITVMDCDHAVQEVYPYKPGMSIERSGYGGTSFDPAFQYINDSKMNRKVDCVLYCTDGWAAEPTVEVKVPVLFVLTTNHAEVPGYKNLVLPEC